MSILKIIIYLILSTAFLGISFTFSDDILNKTIDNINYSKIRNEGEQILKATKIYELEKNKKPTIDDLLNEKYLDKKPKGFKSIDEITGTGWETTNGTIVTFTSDKEKALKLNKKAGSDLDYIPDCFNASEELIPEVKNRTIVVCNYNK